MRESDGPRLSAPAEVPPSPTEVRLKPDTTYGEPYDGPTLFASSIEEPRRRSGLSIWFAAAVSLVLGIVIGFASGYRAGQGTTATLTEPVTSSPTPTSGASPSGQTFSGSTVSDPVRLEPEPVVPSAPEKPAGPRRGPQRAAEPAPQIQSLPVGRVPPRARADAADPPNRQAATGPGSLQVVSRPEGAQVFLDGEPVGRTPLSISDVAAGRHSIRLELPGFNGWATTVDVTAGSPIRVAASLEQ